jgi:hypothetical protein
VAEGLQTGLIFRRKQWLRFDDRPSSADPRSLDLPLAVRRISLLLPVSEVPRFQVLRTQLTERSDSRVLGGDGAVARLHTHQVEPAFRLWPIRAFVLLRARQWPARAKQWGIPLETFLACALVLANRTKAGAARAYPETRASHLKSWDF